jgi:hypothetical protein
VVRECGQGRGRCGQPLQRGNAQNRTAAACQYSHIRFPHGEKAPETVHLFVGSGEIVEEVSAVREHSEPTLQLLQFQDEGNAGYEMIRFCSYTPTGAFRRHPMLAGSGDIEQLREGLKQAPRLRALLARLVEGD